ncbi:Predicted nucleic acid-binding protein, contains Zn-ribbon domain (includes truncated derivatives) [Kytococcus aerolatus]|uniref:Predicted nucleic acid-binding protein, contains Zn-ribbon domain (Includes truncated derivatives) n=1 Tax=Kytococcus aerolatus TaxID=592308 RepID=A0A212THA1_9MICO|nr:DciA family protein [Kytococcus aerolatus]SNC65211.1 Predicted nucleic acid-binding protein, contains Zn-ribbon domain (includes truncated derivatives) [Kytococcus aerolatus]
MSTEPTHRDPRPPAEETVAEPEFDAADLTLARLRDMARARGLRPGAPGRRRKKRTTGGGYRRSSRDPQTLGSELGRLVGERGWEDDLKIGRVMGDWFGIVGADVAAHSQPISFEDGRLVVRAESSTWATQLTMLTATLQSRLDDELGYGVVTEVRIVGPAAPSWKHGRRSLPGRGPRDTYG